MACGELGARSRGSGLDSPSVCDRLLKVLAACASEEPEVAIEDQVSEAHLEAYAKKTSRESHRRRAEALLEK